jgi:hypothetical protein
MDIEVYSPTPPSERGQWLLVLGLFLVGVGVVVAPLSGVLGSALSYAAATQAPVVLVDVATNPIPANASQAKLGGGAGAVAEMSTTVLGGRDGRITAGLNANLKVHVRSIGAAASGGKVGTVATSEGTRAASSVRDVRASTVSIQSSGADVTGTGATEVPISAAWEAGFYSIYGEAQRVFGVDWLLLASIHKQETDFSTAPSTYHGLNFAGCCGGPMQFNVTDGPVSTWDLVRNAYLFGRRPAVYDHRAAHHPSIYDDFDSIMAAAWLLSSDGAGLALDDSAWWAAYDYYGHDAAGVEYADEVLARAIGWSQHGFCINCGVEPTMFEAVYEAYGAPVMATYTNLASAAPRIRRRA